MTAAVFVSAGLIGMVVFFAVPNRLRALEILFTWTWFIFLEVNYVFIVSLNMERVKYALKPAMFFSHLIAIVVLNPLLVMGMLIALAASRRTAVRACWVALFAGLVTGLEYAESRIHVLLYRHWPVLWSFLIWFGMLLLAAACHGWYHRVLNRELGGIG